MHAQLSRALKTTLVTGGLIVAGAVAAQADDNGILSGLDIEAPINAPVDVNGLAVGILGDAATTSPDVAPTSTAAPTADVAGGDSDGIASGAAVAAPVNAPISVDTVALGVLGDASSTGGTASTGATEAPTATIGSGDSDGVASGASAASPVNIPVTIDGLAVGVAGDASTDGSGDGEGASTASAPTATVGGGSSDGTLSGLGAAAPVNVPVTVGNVSLGILGDASSTGGTGTGTTEAPTADIASGDSDGIASGTGIAAPINVPVTIGNVSLGVLGDASTTGGSGSGTTEAPTADIASGDTDGALTALALAAPINVPVTIDGLALGVLGDAQAESSADDVTAAPAATVGGSTSRPGLLRAIRVAAPVNVPVTVGGTAAGLLGDAAVTAPGSGFALPDEDFVAVDGTGSDPADSDGADGTDGTETGTGTGTGTSGDGSGAGTGATPGSGATTDVVTVANLTSAALATDRAAALRSSAVLAGAMTLPAALAPTGGSTGMLSLVATALLALGTLLRRAPRLSLV